MIKAITNLKIGVNTKMLITLYKHLIQSVILYAAPVLLLACNTALQNLERTQRVPLRYILGLPNETNSIMKYRESGILPLRFLIKKETATYLLRAATKSIQTEIIQRNRHKNIHHGINPQAAWNPSNTPLGSKPH
jgi:hypothetical protein